MISLAIKSDGYIGCIETQYTMDISKAILVNFGKVNG